MYNINDYGTMIADKVRMDPYAYALKAVIKPDSVVLDIGAATGIHTLLACKFGARKIYAVEPNDAIHLAREMAQENGFADRIEFIQDISTNITLPERADVIVSDLRGVLPLFGQHIPSIIDARQRHLSPDGLLIPRRDTLWAGLMEGIEIYEELVTPWDRPYGLKMEAAKYQELNNWSYDNTDLFRRRDLLTQPQIWVTLDYPTIESPNVAGAKITQKATRNGMAHGWLLWFDAEIAEGLGFSNAPGVKKAPEVYGRAFFPLLEPVSITAGDSVTLSIRAELIDDDYAWHWQTRIYSSQAPKRLKADFEQSTENTERATVLNQVADHR
jgi:protein arginine N-methyltransferase 1